MNHRGDRNRNLHYIESAEMKLEQLERLRSEDTPAASWLPIPLSHIGSQVKGRQSQSYKFKKFAKIFEFWNGHYTRHTFWSCLIRCANIKWIRWVFLKIQSGHDSVQRRTDGQTDKVIPVYPLSTSLKRGYNYITCNSENGIMLFCLAIFQSDKESFYNTFNFLQNIYLY